jgi:hypothetical protein
MTLLGQFALWAAFLIGLWCASRVWGSPGAVSDGVEAMIAAKVRALRSASAMAPSDGPASLPPAGRVAA